MSFFSFLLALLYRSSASLYFSLIRYFYENNLVYLKCTLQRCELDDLKMLPFYFVRSRATDKDWTLTVNYVILHYTIPLISSLDAGLQIFC